MNNVIIANTPEKINGLRLLTLKNALKLEVIGMKRRGASAFSIVKAEFGLKGNKQSVLDQFVNILKEKGILQK